MVDLNPGRSGIPSEHGRDVRRLESMDLSGSAGPYLRNHGPSISEAVRDFDAAQRLLFNALGIPELIGVSVIANHNSMSEVARIISWGTRTDVPVEQVETEIGEALSIGLPDFADATWGQLVSAVALRNRT